ncbi:MAG: cupin domain-containing protein, partial [Oscillospiraceae bacterium]|nr:cupin domain-containing protein [Oscillospiraceae bacterium]
YEGYDYQDLAFRFTHKITQPLLVTLRSDEDAAALVAHNGQEFNYVVEGTVIITVGDKDIELHKGDSIYFNPQILHGQRRGGDGPATFLTVIAE